MPNNTQSNLLKLFERGVAIETAPGGSSIRIARLPLEMAVMLGHGLTVLLDARGNHPGPYADTSYTFKCALAEASEKARAREVTVFGETRPLEGNIAVRVDAASQDYTLIADLRNEYEDRPELNGGHTLQLGVLAAIKAVEL